MKFRLRPRPERTEKHDEKRGEKGSYEGRETRKNRETEMVMSGEKNNEQQKNQNRKSEGSCVSDL